PTRPPTRPRRSRRRRTRSPRPRAAPRPRLRPRFRRPGARPAVVTPPSSSSRLFLAPPGPRPRAPVPGKEGKPVLRRSPRAVVLWGAALAAAVLTATIVAGDLATLDAQGAAGSSAAANGAAPSTVVIAAGVLVLATDAAPTTTDGERGHDTFGVTLLVDPTQALRVAYAETNGVVTLALVPP